MLEIRDTIKQPILMKENEDKTGAYFLIPSNTKILYVYRIFQNRIVHLHQTINNHEGYNEIKILFGRRLNI